MRGFSRFLMKEIVETTRTWRLPVVGGVALLFALSGPMMAQLTPQLLESLQSSQPGVVIKVPDPTWVDAYAQWIKSLTQIVSFVTIIAASGSVAGEVASGTANLVLTKPVSRGAFVAAKAIALFGLVGGTVVVGTALTQLVTLLVFGEAPLGELWGPTLVWLAFAALLISISILLSSVVSTLAAAGIAVGVFFGISLGALWGPAVTYSPVGLVTAPTALLAGKDPSTAWPVATGIAAAFLFTAMAAALFSRREL